MNLKLVFAALATSAMMLPLTNASNLDTDETLSLLPADFGCETGITHASVPDPFRPGVTMHVSILCPTTDVLDSNRGTDCPGDSYSLWVGPVSKTMAYRYDTSNPYGFSSSAVASAWDGANTVWDSQVAASLFGGSTLGGSGANVGVGDGVNQAGFKALSGSARTAIAVQYAWSSGGKIIESDSGYNTRYAWSTNGAPNTYDLQGVAAQEFGHGYGLGHSDTSTASKCLTMYPYGTAGSTATRTLGDGDINGIKVRYP